MVEEGEETQASMNPPTYADRDKTLAKMGYSSYTEYLNSPLWRRIRVKAFAAHGDRCKICKRRAVIVHHLSYDDETLLGNNVSNLSPLCHRCHKSVEFRPEGGKRSLNEAGVWYGRMVEAGSSQAQTAKKLFCEGKSKSKQKSEQRRCSVCKHLLRRNGNPKCRNCLKFPESLDRRADRLLNSVRVKVASNLAPKKPPRGQGKLVKMGWTLKLLKSWDGFDAVPTFADE